MASVLTSIIRPPRIAATVLTRTRPALLRITSWMSGSSRVSPHTADSDRSGGPEGGWRGSLPSSARLRVRVAVVTVVAAVLTAVVHAGSPAILVSGATDDVTLPAPTGPYSVGVRSLHLVDSSRPETFTYSSSDVREFMVHLWYPARVPTAGERADYMHWRNGSSIARWLLPDRTDLYSYYRRTETNASENVPMAEGEDRYPVVLFSPGLGLPDRAYTVFFEELASRGFVVAAISHAYFSGYTIFPDGSWVVTAPRPTDSTQAAWLEEHSHIVNEDASFVLDTLETLDAGDPEGTFTGRLDLVGVGMFGHSYGGGNSLDMTLLDRRVRAAVDIDGGSIYHADGIGTERPVMFFLNPERWYLFQSIRDAWHNLRGPGYQVTVGGTTHISFIDNGWILTQLAGYDVMEDDDWRLGSMDPAVLVEIERSFVATFFEVYLKHRPIEELLQLHSRFADVDVELNSIAAGGPRPPRRRASGR